MGFELKQTVKLTQQLVMTPQLQQAIKLLQMSRLELANAIQQELQENPVLEEAMDADEERESAERAEAEINGLEPQPTPDRVDDTEFRAEAETPEYEEGRVEFDTTESSASETQSAGDAQEVPEVAAEAEPTIEEKVADLEWENYMESQPQTGLAGGRDDEDRPSFETTLTRRPLLSEHLLWQLQVSDFGDDEKEAARWIIGNLDDEGFLRASVEDLAHQSDLPQATIERALAKVQLFDPSGVAARDLRECLLIQLRHLECKDMLMLELIEHHLPALEKRDFRNLARILGVPIEELSAAAKRIGMLEPRPGRAFGGDDPVYITPDIYVYKFDDDFHIVLNEDGLPKLRINKLYRQVMSSNDVAPKDTKDYVSEKVRSAIWLIKSIHQRQRTIYRVMQSIIRFQRDFFEKGIAYLKPLNLRDVADDIQMHESTVSRVTSNKYVHTPQGIFELKYFFNSSINRFDGEAVASESVKAKIRKIIAAEDPRRPLSDQRIAEMLKAVDLDIARRTVTKYREAMNILSSTQRRRVG